MINNTDCGVSGGEAIGISLAHNHTLQQLDVSDNSLGNNGAIPILKTAHRLADLSIAKNNLDDQCGAEISKLLQKSKSLKKLNLEFNELMTAGAELISAGIQKNCSLLSLNLTGNVIGDNGAIAIFRALILSKCNQLEHINLSLNEISP